MSRKTKPLLYGNGSVQIDPLNCSSSVSFRIYRGRWNKVPQGVVSITSCDKMVNWNLDFGDGEDAEMKLDRAIAGLIDARRSWRMAMIQHRKEKAARRARKK